MDRAFITTATRIATTDAGDARRIKIIRQEQQQQQQRQDLNPIKQQTPAPANDKAGESGQEEGDEDDEVIDTTPKIARCLEILCFTHIKAMKIVEEGLDNYDDFRSHTEKDIQGMI